MKYLDLNTWKRKNHYNFFKTYEDPSWGITTNLNCTKIYHSAKTNNSSLFLTYLHCSLLAANKIEALKLRMDDVDRVELYDHVDAGATVNRPDGTFGFSYLAFDKDPERFYKNAQLEIEKARSSDTLDPASNLKNVIYFSSLPWINFSSISYARQFKKSNGIPKISFGKITQNHLGEYQLPVSIDVNHALVDGKDVGDFITLFQEILIS